MSKATKKAARRKGIIIGSLASALTLGVLIGGAGYSSGTETAANELKPLDDWKSNTQNWDTKFQTEILDSTEMLDGIRYIDGNTTRHDYNESIVKSMVDENVLGKFSIGNAFIYMAPSARHFRENQDDYRTSIKDHLENQDKNLLFDYLNSYCKTAKYLTEDVSNNSVNERHEFLIMGEESAKDLEDSLKAKPENFDENGTLKPEYQEKIDEIKRNYGLDKHPSFINRGLGTVISVEYIDEANAYCGLPLEKGFALTEIINNSARENLAIIKGNFEARRALQSEGSNN